MAEAGRQNKFPQAVFAFYVWQTDLVREITSAEAEAFFRLLEDPKNSGLNAAELAEVAQAYTKLWRDYVKQGPPPPTELSLLTHTIGEKERAGLIQILSALHRATPMSKRRQTVGLTQALKSLLERQDSALTDLQRYFRQSRFYEARTKAEVKLAEPAAMPAPQPALPKAEGDTLPSVPASPKTAVAESRDVGISEKVFEPAESVIPVLKLVPWSEHDAVNPERLQFWTKGSRAMRCINIIERNRDFKSFQFMAEEPTLFFYKPGQFVTLEVMIDGKRHVRSYTISSSPSRPHLIEISVKRLKNGIVSNYLHDKLMIGDTLMIKPPAGKFHCFDAPADKYLFLAAGSGITPMLSMARWWHDTGAHPDVVFFHSVREPEDAVFAEDMITFTSANRKFRYVTSFTSTSIPDTWPGMKGRFDEEKLMRIAPDFDERVVFTCGPDSFMKLVKLVLEKHKFRVDERYRQESFGAANIPKTEAKAEMLTFTKPATVDTTPAPAALHKPAKTATSPGTSSPVVHFSLSSMEVFGGDMDVPILDLAEEVGVQIPSSCRAGTCGTCRAMKIKGEIECDDTPGLTDADREAGYILTCVSRAKNYVELEV